MKINFVITIRKENMKMIKGIEVLTTNNIYTCADWCVIGFNIFLVISFLSFMLVLICNTDEDISDTVMRIIYIIYGISAICVITFGFCTKFSHSKFDHVEYQVTISDDTSMMEFNSKYEIVNQNGKIYTIKEKENKNGK